MAREQPRRVAEDEDYPEALTGKTFRPGAPNVPPAPTAATEDHDDHGNRQIGREVVITGVAVIATPLVYTMLLSLLQLVMYGTLTAGTLHIMLIALKREGLFSISQPVNANDRRFSLHSPKRALSRRS